MASGKVVPFERPAPPRRRRLGGRWLALCVATFLATVGGGLYASDPHARAAVAFALRDPVMDLPGPFESCAAAHAAGWYSIPRGSPAYAPSQDADGDGLACEPYGGPRWRDGFDRRLMRWRAMAR